MKKTADDIVMEILQDKSLYPYFVDYIGENLKTAFYDRIGAANPDPGFKAVATAKLEVLVDQLESKVPQMHLEFVIAQVCKYYANMVHLKFQEQHFCPTLAPH